MRTLLVTSEEPLYLPRYLEPVVREHAGGIAAVVLAPPRRSTLAQVREQYRTFGPRAFVRLGARAVAGTLADQLSGGRPVGGRYHSVASLARAHDLPVWHATDVTDAAFVDRVHDLDPDLLLSVVASQKLGPELLAVPDEAINLHGSLLPNYRGRATAFWPLYYGDDVTGVTAHRMTDEWDAGPIVERRTVPITGDETVHSLYRKLADCGGDLACDLLDRYPCEFETEPNDTTPGDYHSVPTAAQRRAFRRRGGRFV